MAYILEKYNSIIVYHRILLIIPPGFCIVVLLKILNDNGEVWTNENFFLIPGKKGFYILLGDSKKTPGGLPQFIKMFEIVGKELAFSSCVTNLFFSITQLSEMHKVCEGMRLMADISKSGQICLIN